MKKLAAYAVAALGFGIYGAVTGVDRLIVTGWSYGGMMTNHVITKTNRFKAAATGASATLYVVNYGHDQYQRWWEQELGFPWEPEAREIYEGFIRRNQDPALLEWIGTGMFKTSVFPVPAENQLRGIGEVEIGPQQLVDDAIQFGGILGRPMAALVELAEDIKRHLHDGLVGGDGAGRRGGIVGGVGRGAHGGHHQRCDEQAQPETPVTRQRTHSHRICSTLRRQNAGHPRSSQ